MGSWREMFAQIYSDWHMTRKTAKYHEGQKPARKSSADFSAVLMHYRSTPTQIKLPVVSSLSFISVLIRGYYPPSRGIPWTPHLFSEQNQKLTFKTGHPNAIAGQFPSVHEHHFR